MATAEGYNVSLGVFTNADSGWTTSNYNAAGLATTAVSRAEAVWKSYYGVNTTNSRMAVASYFFALESIGEEYIRLRIGNIGSAKESQIAEMIVEKGMALIEAAKVELKKYEDYCASEARVDGATAHALINGAIAASTTGADAATALLSSIACDGKTPPRGYGNFVTSIGRGMAMQILSGQIAQHTLGTVGARNPAIGQHYLNAAQTLAASGAAAIKGQVDRIMTMKPQSVVGQLGI
jgi:hypothetical protein